VLFTEKEVASMSDAIRSVAIALVLGVLALLFLAVGLFICLGQHEGHSTIGGRQVIVRSTLLTGIGVADGSPNGQPMTVNVGGRSVLVSADEVDVVGVRKVALAPECKKVEIVQASGGVRVLLDGVEAK
jgi:hypothetical protein